MGSMLFMKFISFKLSQIRKMDLNKISSVNSRIELDDFIQILNLCSCVEKVRFAYKWSLESVFMYLNEKVIAIISDKGIASVKKKVA